MFPAHAGLIPGFVRTVVARGRVPRARGADSYVSNANIVYVSKGKEGNMETIWKVLQAAGTFLFNVGTFLTGMAALIGVLKKKTTERVKEPGPGFQNYPGLGPDPDYPMVNNERTLSTRIDRTRIPVHWNSRACGSSRSIRLVPRRTGNHPIGR